VLFEGYPRLRDQAPFLEQLPWRLVVAIHLVVPTEQRRQRLDQRVLDRETGRVGRASQASSETSIRRPEDAPESLAARLIDWERDTLPLLEHYRAQALLLDVNGVGPEEEITHRIAAAINGRL
jgi:adenylate kinase family enzyme